MRPEVINHPGPRRSRVGASKMFGDKKFAACDSLQNGPCQWCVNYRACLVQKDKGPLFPSLFLFPLPCVSTDSLQVKIPPLSISHWWRNEGEVSLYCEHRELRSGWLPALNDALLELIKEEHLQRSKGPLNPALTLYSYCLLCLSDGGNDGVMINIWLGWGSFSPASMCHHVFLDDGRHASQLAENWLNAQ